MSFPVKKFCSGAILSFMLMALLTTYWIPFDYPTAPFWVVKFWQANDQLFRVHNYGLIVIPLAVLIGLAFGRRINVFAVK